jgi:hypothetical protein
MDIPPNARAHEAWARALVAVEALRLCFEHYHFPALLLSVVVVLIVVLRKG